MASVEQRADTDATHHEHASRLIALLDGSEAGDAVAALLLEDFSSALAAYVWMSGALKPQVERVDGGTASLPDGATAIVVALPADEGAAKRLSRTLDVLGLPETDAAPPLVYAIAYIKETAGTADASRLGSLAAACQARGTRWGGGIALGESALYPKLFRSPRLGAYRRPLSQAIDRLVAAARMNATMRETARITGRAACENVTAANPGLAPLARLLFSSRAL